MTTIPFSVLDTVLDGLRAEVALLQQIAEHELNSGEIDAWSITHGQADDLLQLVCELQVLQCQGAPTGLLQLIAA